MLIGMVYSYLPFMVLPLFATLQKLDRSLLEAASDLGATPQAAFFTVTLPLSLPGILAGAALVFIPAIGEFVIPDLLGGPETGMIGKVLWTEFFSNRDWPLASAVAVVLLLVLVLPLALLQRARLTRGSAAVRRLGPGLLLALIGGFAFLYLPILALIAYSFNASRLVTVWGGFSTRWYGALLENQPLLDAAWLSLRLALVSATLATLLGTLAALALARHGSFSGAHAVFGHGARAAGDA